MKIILLNSFESTGGAAIAANRLMKALIDSGIDAKTLVLKKQTDDENVISVQSSFLKKQMTRLNFLWERWVIFIHNRFNRTNLFAISTASTGFDISRHPLIREADIIHIHWINQGFLSLRSLKSLVDSGKPVVWTMHDMWPCTGICHHARECDHFTKACGQCFFLQSKKDKDLSRKIFNQKKKLIFSNGNITFAGCSQWLANKAKISGLSKNHRITSIPNPIDITAFKVLDKQSAREKLKLPEDKKIILFGAANVTDKRKGFDYLIDALNKMVSRHLHTDICVVVFGQVKSGFTESMKIPLFTMGYMRNRDEIVALYNAVDLYVTPSLEENLPNTIMEAMACGTPCVGFHTGGIPEMIDHKQNGYVAEYKNSTDLADGMQWVLHVAGYDALSNNARKKVESTYSEAIVAKQYIELYNKSFDR